jgi:hypothetical protein
MENEERTTLRQDGGRDALVFHRRVPVEGVEVLIGRFTMFVAEMGDSFGVGAVYGEISTPGMARAAWVPVMLPPPMRPMCVVIVQSRITN